MSEVRVRFAPSPTGPLHIGGVRTALYNYLFAKKHNGKFILRVEDTDQTRFVENAEAYITQSLEWCGLTLDESPTLGGNFGPYKQSERLAIYNQQIPTLMQSGFAYYAFDTAEELDALRKDAETNGKVFTYNSATRNGLNNSLNLSETEVQEKLKSEPYVIRFKMPENRVLVMNDLIRGEFSVNTNDLDDKVLVKADGFPTYHFANIIDDHFMEISHVIRGEEWLPSMPLHVLLYEAMQWNAPEFAHLPLILKPVGNGKLSKRDGAKFGFPVFPLNWKESETETYQGFKEDGYLPEALNNILVLLGWSSPSGKEILTLEEMIAEFDLGKVHKSGARFDIDKAKNIQKEFLQKLSTQELTSKYQEALQQQNLDFTHFNTSELVDLVKERAVFVEDMIAETLFFFQKPTSFEEKDLKKVWKEDTKEIIEKFLLDVENITFTEADIHDAIKQFTETHSIGFGKIMMPLRLALVGEMKGPDVPKIIEILGKEEVKNRLAFLVKEAS